jgi:hypothetical protein
MPINLHGAVARHGARNLTCASKSKRGGAMLPADAPDMGQIIKNGCNRPAMAALRSGGVSGW